MRVFDSQDQAIWDSRSFKTEVKVEIEDDTGALRIWTDLINQDTSFVQSVKWEESRSNPFPTADIEIIWKKDNWNTSPFSTSSKVSSWVDLHREVRIYTKTYPSNSDGSGFPWVLQFLGRIDNYDLSSDVGSITCRDFHGTNLMDSWIRTNTVYGDDGGTKDIEDVIADIVSDWVVSAPTIIFLAPTGFAVQRYIQEKMPVFTAIQNIIQQAGLDLRVRRNVPGNDFDIVIYEPDRNTALGTQFTVSDDKYYSISAFESSIEDLRNHIVVYYGDGVLEDELGNADRLNVVVQDLVSIAKYGRRHAEFYLGSTNLIKGAATALALANFALQDLGNPVLGFSVQLTHFFEPVEINDFYVFEPEGKRFTSSASLSIEGYSHTVSADGAFTELIARGDPQLDVDSWIDRSSGTGRYLVNHNVFPDAPVLTAQNIVLGGICTVSYPKYFDAKTFVLWRSATSGFTPDDTNIITQSSGKVAIIKDKSFGTWFVKAAIKMRDGKLSLFSNEVSYTPLPVPLDEQEGAGYEIELRSTNGITNIPTSGTSAIQFPDIEWIRGGSGGTWYDPGNREYTINRYGLYEIELRFVSTTGNASEGWRGFVKILTSAGVLIEDVFGHTGEHPSLFSVQEVSNLKFSRVLNVGEKIQGHLIELSGIDNLNVVNGYFGYRHITSFI